MKLNIPNLDEAIKAMADEDLAHWDQQCPREHYEALLQAAWNTICIANDDIGGVTDIAPMFRSKLFQQFLSQGFWHAHHVDLMWRYNGQDVREEADWLKDLWYFVRGRSTAPSVATEEQRPVAWKYEASNEHILAPKFMVRYEEHRRGDLVDEGWSETPLFAHPSPSQDAIMGAAREITRAYLLHLPGAHSQALIDAEEDIGSIIIKHLGPVKHEPEAK